jgi:hypothetical protein
MKLLAIRKIKALKNKGSVLQLMEIKSRYILLEITELNIIKRTNKNNKFQLDRFPSPFAF